MKQYHLPQFGSKATLIERISLFLEKGIVKTIDRKKESRRDSDVDITRSRFVKYYHNDRKTRDFFEKELGKQFKFNNYLRQFRDPRNIKPGLTYGDLCDGWLSFEESKNSEKTVIGDQFKYNQFIRDYFSNSTNPTMDDAINVWQEHKSLPI